MVSEFFSFFETRYFQIEVAESPNPFGGNLKGLYRAYSAVPPPVVFRRTCFFRWWEGETRAFSSRDSKITAEARCRIRSIRSYGDSSIEVVA